MTNSSTETWTDPARLAANERIAKIERTTLGYEDHGILTCWLHCNYGGSGQGIGGWALDGKPTEKMGDRTPHEECGRWVMGVMKACGVRKWEDVAGRSIIVILDGDRWGAMPIGIRPLPTERGEPFMFSTGEEPT